MFAIVIVIIIVVIIIIIPEAAQQAGDLGPPAERPVRPTCDEQRLLTQMSSLHNGSQR